MRVHLIEIAARLADGAVVPVRLSSVNESRACHLDGLQWDPAILALPTLRYDFFGGAFANALVAPSGSFTVAQDGLAQVPPAMLADLRFGKAAVRIWSGSLGDDFTGYRLRFAGEIQAEPTIEEGVLTFTAGVAEAYLDLPIMAQYAGTDGLEGPEDLAGTVKPLVLGDCRFVPGVLIDAVENVYQVSAYGPVQAISAAFDRLASLGPSFGDYPDLAALVAASVPAGSWATCRAQGLVRLGAPADGKVCFHVEGDAGGARGFVSRAGGMIARFVELAGGTYDDAMVTALDIARPWDQGRVINAQVTARQMIQELADSVAAVAGISWTGQLFVKPFTFSEAEIALDAAGTSVPPVSDVSQQAVDAPYWRLATTAARTWLLHDLAEIASAYTPRGLYSATRVYRQDDLVSAEDGRSFVYINAVPAAGNAPPAAPNVSNAHWTLYNAADITATAQLKVDPIPAIVITASSDNVTTTALPVQRRIVLRRGGTDVSSLATFTTTTAPGGTAGSFGSGGDANLFSLTQADANGTFVVVATLNGIDYPATIEIARNRAPAPITGGPGNTASIQDADWTPISSGTYAVVSDADMIIRSSASGTLAWSYGGQYEGALGYTAQNKVQYSLDGSSWTDATGSEQMGSAVEDVGYGYAPGYVANSATQTGLTPSTDYYWRLLSRRAAGLGSASFNSENFSISQP